VALIAVTSATGAPGATVTSLALALSWPRSSLLVECDPAGGSVLTGYLGGGLPADRGLAQLAYAHYQGRLYDDFAGQLIYLDGAGKPDAAEQRLLLPGVTDPAQAAALPPMWDSLGGYLRQLERSDPPIDAIADCGRVPALHAPMPLIRHADVVLLVVGRTLSAISAAKTRVPLLREETERRGVGVLRLVVRGRGEYDHKEIAKLLGTAVAMDLPEDTRTADMLSGGTGRPRPNATLLRATRSGSQSLQTLIESRRAAANVPTTRPEAVRA